MRRDDAIGGEKAARQRGGTESEGNGDLIVTQQGKAAAAKERQERQDDRDDGREGEGALHGQQGERREGKFLFARALVLIRNPS